jgi:hypothetical protein
VSYSLCRDRDGVGDSGPLSAIFTVSDDGKEREFVEGEVRPKVGYQIMVGSLYARTYQMQDWWQTSPVVEILEDTENMVRFRTHSGSVYTWREI